MIFIKFKRLISLLLAVLTVLSVMSVSSFAASAKRLGDTTVTSCKSNKAGQITLTWKKPSYSFDAFQIIYTSFDNFSYSNFKYCHYANVAKGKTSHTLNLIPGVHYKISIRTYKKEKGGNIYGYWSKHQLLYTKAAVGAKISSYSDLLNKKLKVTSMSRTNCQMLNNALDRIINKVGARAKGVSNFDKLKKIYKYIATEQFKKDKFEATGNTSYKEYPEGSVLQMLRKKKKGSCYEYNYLFMYLCKRLGINDAYIVSGTVPRSGGGREGHYWVMIKINGSNYYFDPRMQRYMDSTKYTFFCLPMNGANTYSNYYRFYDADTQIKK